MRPTETRLCMTSSPALVETPATGRSDSIECIEAIDVTAATDNSSDSCDDCAKVFDSLPISKTSALKRRLSKYLRSRYLTRKSVQLLDVTEDASHLISIDARSHLEVFDPKHRYGKNLRVYYEQWARQSCRSNSIRLSISEDARHTPFTRLDKYERFFAWLDDPKNPPSIDACSRDTLEGDTVTYCKSSSDRARYAVTFDSRGRLHRTSRASQVFVDVDEDEASLLSTGRGGHIFVARDHVLYTHEKRVEKPPRFHHSSFFAGDVVEAAGILVCEGGTGLVLYPHSGHYRPKDKHFLNLLLFLRTNRVDLASVTVDVQRTFRTARLVLPCGEKTRKRDAAWMWGAVALLDFLSVKVRAWDKGLFEELVRRAVDRSHLRRIAVETQPQQPQQQQEEEEEEEEEEVEQGVPHRLSDVSQSSCDSLEDESSREGLAPKGDGDSACSLCALS